MNENTFKKKYGDWVLIAGAAEGLGEAYSNVLASKKMNLIMVDNNETAVFELSKKIELDFKVTTIPLVLNLKDSNAVEKMLFEINKVGCRLLIYNAAYSLIKPFVNHTEDELDNFIEINTKTQLKLVHQFAQYLISTKQTGGILLMSSLAGLIGMQLVATYAATKAFAWNLAEALHHELKPQNIDVLACVAGATATPAYLKTNPTYGFFKPLVMKPEEVAKVALNQFGKRAIFIPGFSNRINYFILTRLLPRKMAASIANKTMLGMFKHQI